MKNENYFGQRISRRSLLGAGLAGIGLNGARLLGVPMALGQVAQAMAAVVSYRIGNTPSR